MNEELKRLLGGLLDKIVGDPTTSSGVVEEISQMIPVEEAPNLFNMATDFVTDIEPQPEWRVPENKDFTHYAPDMSNVDFGGVLPERNDIESLILEASAIAGVDPEFTEGYRTLEQNQLVGGNKKSKHMFYPSQAFDLAISGNKDQDLAYERELKKRFEPLGFSVVLFSGKNHIHLQKPRPGG